MKTMKEQLRVDVEPLTEQQWAKIDRSLMTRIRLETGGVEHKSKMGRYPSLSTWLAAALVVSAMMIGLLALKGPSAPTALEQPSRITTGQSGSHLSFPGLTLDVEPGSAVVVGAETPSGLLLVLDSGSIVCQVAKRSSDAPLIVQAGAVRVQVVGTRFRVIRQGESATVEVFEGIVEVTSGGRSQRVHGGQRWPVQVPPRIEDRSTLEVPDSNAPLTAAPSRDRGETSARPVPEVAPNGRSAAAQSSSLPSDPPRKSTAAKSKATESKAAKAQARALHTSEPQSATSVELSSKKNAAGTGVTSQAMFEQATALERSDPKRASTLYRKLESGSDTWAQHALYARGRLAASRGDHAEARRLLERYLERFPRGSNAQDALAVLRGLR